MKKIYLLVLIILLPFGCTHYYIKNGIENIKQKEYFNALKNFSKAELSEEYKASYYFEIANLFEFLNQYEISIDFYKKAIIEAKKTNEFNKIKKNSTTNLKRTIDKKYMTIEEGIVPIKIVMKSILVTKKLYYGFHMVSERECSQTKCHHKTLKCEKNIYNDLFTTYKQIGCWKNRIDLRSDEYGYILDKKGQFLKFKRVKENSGEQKQIFWIKMTDIEQLKKISKDSYAYELYADKFSITDKITAYKKYLNDYPKTEYKKITIDRIEQLSFELAKKNNSVTSYNKYIFQYPEGRYYIEAIKHIDILSFQFARKENSINAYSHYINIHPNGNFVGEAKLYIEDLYFNNAMSKQTIETFNDYLLTYPDGKFIDKAKDQIEKLVFSQAFVFDELHKKTQGGYSDTGGYCFEKINNEMEQTYQHGIYSDKKLLRLETSVKLYRDYLSKYPNGKYKEKAEKRVLLITEVLIFNKAIKENTIKSYSKYIDRFPNGKFSVDVIWKMFSIKNKLYLYKKFVASYPKSKHTVIAKQIINKMAFEKCKTRNCYEKYIKDYKKNPYTKKALENILTLSKKSISSYNRFIEKYPDTHLRQKVINELFELYKKKNTINGYKEFIKRYPKSQNLSYIKDRIFVLNLKNKKPESLYLKAGDYERNNEFYYANRIYKYIIDNFPKDKLAIKSNDRMLVLSEKIKKIQKQKELLEEKRKRESNPCYGIQLIDWWSNCNDGGLAKLLNSVTTDLWVKVKNTSNTTKLVHFSYYNGSDWYYTDEYVKIYAGDIIKSKIDCYRKGVSYCYDYKNIRISYCE